MKHLFIPYELAVIAKDKGFNKRCLACINPKGQIEIGNTSYLMAFMGREAEDIFAPLYQQIVDWLCEDFGIWITVLNYDHSEPTDKLPRGFSFYISEYGFCVYGEKESVKSGYFKTHYEALNKAIEEAFKLI